MNDHGKTDGPRERELIEKLAQGDQFSFGLVFHLYYSRLYHFALHYLNDEEASKDIIQDVFASVWIEKEKLAGVKNLSSWLYTIAKNLCLKKIDHLKVRQKHADELKYRYLNVIQLSLNDLDTSPVLFDEISRIMDQTLRQLPAQGRHIFELSRFENKKNAEIADELHISVKTVEAHITRALKDLRKALRHYLPVFMA
ncbi:MAG: RNA polymerase sigma-70 factor [Mangrovibacterium sp.]|nr:RNA polymerase sigma-70 factor [Mangrovibacterium sp.]